MRKLFLVSLLAFGTGFVLTTSPAAGPHLSPLRFQLPPLSHHREQLRVRKYRGSRSGTVEREARIQETYPENTYMHKKRTHARSNSVSLAGVTRVLAAKAREIASSLRQQRDQRRLPPRQPQQSSDRPRGGHARQSVLHLRASEGMAGRLLDRLSLGRSCPHQLRSRRTGVGPAFAHGGHGRAAPPASPARGRAASIALPARTTSTPARTMPTARTISGMSGGHGTPRHGAAGAITNV